MPASMMPMPKAGTRFERDCANDSGAALLSNGRIRATKPTFVDGAEAII
jgi:hypothetical protein